MLLLYILISFCISWIWIQYFRDIDVFEKESTKELAGVFLLGTMSVLIVHFVHYLFGDYFVLETLEGDLGLFLHHFIEVGLLEELSKLTLFGVAYIFVKNKITEPLDIIIYVCLCALGFAAAENVQYFYRHGAYLIGPRSILCSVGHMIFSSFMAYGLVQIIHLKKPTYQMAIYILLAALSHGIYNFILSFNAPFLFTLICALIYFMISVSIFCQILNNAMNASHHFSYNLSILPDKITKRILLSYLGVIGLQFIASLISADPLEAFFGLIYVLLFCSFIILVCALRVSRFKIRKGQWIPLKLELPFSIIRDVNGKYLGLVIKGETYNENLINLFYKRDFHLVPLSTRSSYIGKVTKAFLSKKHFTSSNDAIFEIKNSKGSHSLLKKRLFIMSKTNGEIRIQEKHPIVGLYTTSHEELSGKEIHKSEFQFIEWCYLVDIESS